MLDLTPAGITQLTPLLESEDPAAPLRRVAPHAGLPRLPLSKAQLCALVERQEVRAAGVTCLRSKMAVV
ncbi:MAG: hypothetical protein ABSC18_10885 [Verrucomicrobiota bacterium]